MWIEMILDNMVFFWVAVFIFAAIIEAISLGLASVWFAIGSLVACFVAWLGGGIPLQVAVFFVVSILLIIFTRPIMVKKLKVGREKNVTEQIQGHTGLVTQTVEPFGSGLVKVDGAIWTAIGESPEVSIATGRRVEVVRIEGVKLIVKECPLNNRPGMVPRPYDKRSL